jgi:formyltetrahydrofolate synthetase
MFHGNELDLDPDAITWPRTLDMNDRALRTITVSVTGADKKRRDGSDRSSGFLITAASEIMAILALASSREDLRARLARIVIGQNREGLPVRASDLHATGPMMALLSEALLPNLVHDGGHTCNGTLRAICEHRARHEFGGVAANGDAAGGLRGERDRLRIGPRL